MGWWKVVGTEDVVGDDPFDIIRDATLQIAQRYEQALGRRPTRSEWERILLDGLQPDLGNATNDGKPLAADFTTPTAVTITIE